MRLSTWRCATSGSEPPVVVPADGQGRLRLDALGETLAHGEGPVIVCLQAGNVHSGAFDPIAAGTALAHQHGAWVHADGAFGLWAAASPRPAHLTEGRAAVDCWATDTRRSTCPTTAASRSSPARARSATRWASTPVTWSTRRDQVTLSTGYRSSHDARGVPVWPLCARWAALASPSSSTGSPRMLAHWPTGSSPSIRIS